MHQITLTIPDEALLALNTTPERIGDELRLAASIKLYELGRISSGAAAQLAGIPRVSFLTKLASYGVATFQVTDIELQAEIKSADNGR